MRQTRIIMGMPVQLEIVAPDAPQAAYDAVFTYLTDVDARFSTYKNNSEISRINRGEIMPREYSPEMQEIISLADDTTQATNGYFSIHTPAGLIDPSGIVKGWAIRNAAQMLEAQGFTNFYLEVAGDIQTKGKNAEGQEWSIGIRNPFAHDQIVKVVYPHGNGIATSGTAARGNHIYNPHDPGSTDFAYVSLTVIGPDVYEADRFATAAFVMGEAGMQLLESLPEFEAYAIDAKGKAVMTTGFTAYTTI